MDYKFTHEDDYFKHYTIVFNNKTVRIHESKAGKGVYINEKDMAKALNFRNVKEMKTELWRKIVENFQAINLENEDLETEIPTQTATPMAARSANAQSQAEWVEHAGISGVYNGPKSPAFWAGGTLAQALENETSIVLRMDGSGQLADGNIYWDENGNLTVMGRFESNIDGVRLILDPALRALIMKDANNNDIATLNIESSSDFGSRSSLRLINTNAGREAALSVYPEGLTAYDPNTQKNAGIYSHTGAWNEPYIFVGSEGDGSPTAEANNPRFAAFLSASTLYLCANKLPISPQNLPSGTVWRDGDILKIVP